MEKIREEMILLGLKTSTEEHSIREYFKDILKRSPGMTIETITLRQNKCGKKAYAILRVTDLTGQMKIQGEHKIEGAVCTLQAVHHIRENTALEHDVYVGFSDPALTRDKLRKHFEREGTVERVYVPSPWKPYAFVTFSSAKVAQELIGKRQKIQNVEVTIRGCTGRRRSQSPSPSPPRRPKASKEATELWTQLARLGTETEKESAKAAQHKLYQESHLSDIGFPNPFEEEDTTYITALYKYDATHNFREPEVQAQAQLLAWSLNQQIELKRKLERMEVEAELNMATTMQDMDNRVTETELAIAHLPSEITSNPSTSQLKRLLLKHVRATLEMMTIVRKTFSRISNEPSEGDTHMEEAVTTRKQVHRYCTKLKRIMQTQQKDLDEIDPSEVD